MYIFYPTDTLISRLDFRGKRAVISTSTGYGHITEQIREHLIRAGHDIVPTPEDADVELYVGQPTFKRRPDMLPAAILTMHEATSLPSGWVEAINSYSCLITPSDFCKHNFTAQGVSIPIYKVHLGVSQTRFPFIERDFNTTPFSYIAQCVQVTDRKNAILVEQLFLSGKMPVDACLLVKSIPYPNITGTSYDIQISDQVRWVEANLSFAELKDLFANIHCSVNPSSCEGFGLLPAEHASTGMATILTNYSGFAEFATAPGFIPLNNFKLLPSLNFPGSVDAYIDEDELLAKMLWAYENREEAYECGKKAAEYVRIFLNYERTVSAIADALNIIVKDIRKAVLPALTGEELLCGEMKRSILS